MKKVRRVGLIIICLNEENKETDFDCRNKGYKGVWRSLEKTITSDYMDREWIRSSDDVDECGF